MNKKEKYEWEKAVSWAFAVGYTLGILKIIALGLIICFCYIIYN